jgi:hypothetical protein
MIQCPKNHQIMNLHRDVINLLAAKSTMTEVSCEGPIMREKSKTHVLQRAHQGR